MVRESQKRETRRAMCPLGSSRWSKPKQPSFLLVHGKPVFRKTLWQYVQHPLGVLPIAEHQYRIVSETHQEAPAPQVPPDYLVKPSVEHLVQVDVAEQRRKHPALRRPLLRVAHRATLHHTSSQPLWAPRQYGNLGAMSRCVASD